jgi:hypothetical protein
MREIREVIFEAKDRQEPFYRKIYELIDSWSLGFKGFPVTKLTEKLYLEFKPKDEERALMERCVDTIKDHCGHHLAGCECYFCGALTALAAHRKRCGE